MLDRRLVKRVLIVVLYLLMLNHMVIGTMVGTWQAVLDGELFYPNLTLGALQSGCGGSYVF